MGARAKTSELESNGLSLGLRLKKGEKGQVVRYKAHLVAKEYS